MILKYATMTEFGLAFEKGPDFELQAIFPVKRRIISSISQIFFDRSLTPFWVVQVRLRNGKPPWKIMKFCENESFSKFI